MVQVRAHTKHCRTLRINFNDRRRLWVLQEVVLASSNTCYWGTFEFDLLDVVRATSWLNYKVKFLPRGLYSCFGWRCAVEMFDLLDRDNGRHSNGRSLTTVLEVAQHFEKTEARDSIYAILGLIDQDRALSGDEAVLLEVDYTRSLPHVLRDATRYALCENNYLDVLSHVNHQVDMSADSQIFPTWTLRVDLLYQSQDAVGLPYLYHSYEGLEAPSLLGDVSFDKGLLLLQGIVVNQVDQTTVVCHSDIIDDYEEYHQWLVSVKDMVMCHRNIAMQENIDLAIASTLVAGQARSGREVQPDDLKLLVEYIKSLAIREDDIVPDGVSIRSHVDEERMEALLGTVRVYWCQDRRFFVTAEGYLGLGPRCMQPEDIVVVLRGGILPFILPKKADGYWFIGEAYMHGIMYGEAVQIHRSRGESEVVFHVR
jgi:hypothetical protein